MKLTRDYLEIMIRHNTHVGDAGQNKLIKIILENQEKAEKWDFATKNSIIFEGDDGYLLLNWGKLEKENDELRAQIAKVGGRVNRGDPDIKGYTTELFSLNEKRDSQSSRDGGKNE